MSESEVLYRVQELDTRLFELREREEAHPLKAELGEMEEEEGTQHGGLDEVISSLEEREKKQKKMEKEVQKIEEKLRREEGKLYGGKVNNPKELSGLEAEVRSLKRKKDIMETEALEEMERLDELNVKVGEIRSNLERLQADKEEKRKILESETGEIRAEMAELEREREELRQRVDGEMLELYDRLLGSKQQVAVVKAVDGVCQGCRVELPGKEYDRFLKTDVFFRCPTCRRILAK